MLFWLGILSFAVICYAFCSKQTCLSANSNEKFKYTTRCNWFIIVLYALVLIFFAGMRSGIGDTGYYMYGFSEYKGYNFKNFAQLDIEKEAGFKLLMVFISFFTKNEQIFLFVISILIIGISVIAICKYSEDIGMSLFLFVTTGAYVGMMNGIRQYIVVSVFFACTFLIIKGKFVPYLILALIFSTIHYSAFFMIPVFFFARKKKVWSWSTLIFIAVALVSVFSFSNLIERFVNLLENTTYERYADTLLGNQDVGVNYLRILVVLVPTILSFIGRKYVDQHDIYYRVYSNIMLLNCIIYLLASYNWIFARLAMYLNLYVMLFYPYIIKRIFDQKSQKFIKMAMLLLYSIFFIFEIKNTSYMSYYLDINRDLIGALTKTFY